LKFSGYRRRAPNERGCSVGYSETNKQLDTQEDEIGVLVLV
jgi:hypothetical protein